MSLVALLRDWWERRGPEFWNPDEDEDVVYLREQKAAAEASVAMLLREARRNLGRPLPEPPSPARREWRR